jgi:hypothetical protein
MAEPALINTETLVAQAKQWASSGSIDSVNFLKGDNVFLYSGRIDTVVHQVMLWLSPSSPIHNNVCREL